MTRWFSRHSSLLPGKQPESYKFWSFRGENIP